MHNSEVSYLTLVHASPVLVQPNAVIAKIKELDMRQKRIEKWCEELIEWLREHERIEVAPPSNMEEYSSSSEQS